MVFETDTFNNAEKLALREWVDKYGYNISSQTPMEITIDNQKGLYYQTGEGRTIFVNYISSDKTTNQILGITWYYNGYGYTTEYKEDDLIVKEELSNFFAVIDSINF